MDVVVIGHRATLLQYSEVYQDSDIFKAPYTIGLVQVTEGPKLFVPIKSDDPEALQVGASLTFCLLPMPDRNQINFAYTPEETK